MNNGDKPAYPVIQPVMGENCDGLTKREMFAMAAMQGLLSSCSDAPGLEPNITTVSYMAELSVDAADFLLKQLESK